MAKIEPLAGERQKNESARAVQACNDWLRLGRGRSLPALLEQYAETDENQPPTRSLTTLKHWSHKYGWPGRGELYDAEIERIRNERAEEILQSGLALVHERVQELKELSDFLKGQLYEKGEEGVYHNVWLPDVKQIGSGPDAERVDIERFNAPIIDQYRGVLDDIAREVGGRKQAVDLTSGGQAIKGYAVVSPDDWPDEEDETESEDDDAEDS